MAKGMFITIEGTDGSGKSTQSENIKRYLDDRHIEHVFTREPGGTAIGEKIRSIILDAENKEMDPLTETMLYAASRAQLVSQIISPALERGIVVVCDRFVDSSIAYQQYARKLGNKVSVINSYAVAGCMPDLTILLKISADESMRRIKRTADRLEMEPADFHAEVAWGYEELARNFPQRIVAIDAARSVDDVWSDIKKILDEKI